jgi:acyl-CoA thioesterase
MDEDQARAAFAAALATQAPEFGRFFLARLFGLEVSFEDETCVVTAPVHDFTFNPQGSMHGGVIGFILDISMGHLLHHVVGAGVTLEMKIQFVKPPRAGSVRAVGRFLRRGRSISFLESRMTDDAGDLVAAATATWRVIDTKR